MRKIFALCILIGGLFIGKVFGNDLIYKSSTLDINMLITKIKQDLIAKNLTIFAEFDHRQNALDVKLDLRPTFVIVFGDPAVGTYLMQENQQIAIELPLKLVIWQDENNIANIGYLSIKNLAKQYGIKNQKVVDKIESLMQNLISKYAQ